MRMKPWQGFIISLLLGVTGIFVIIRLTGSINISRLNFFWFLGSIGIVIVWWIAESMSLKTILSAVNLKLGLFQILKIMLSSFFFGAITPFNSGFLPAELVLLKGANIDLELSFPVVMVKMILNGLLRGLLAIALGIYLRGSLGFLAGRIVFIVLTIYGFVSILGYFILFSKNRYSNFLRALICKFFDSLGNKFNFIGRISIHISNSLKNGPQTIEPLLKNTSWLSKTLSWSLLFWVSQFSLPYFLLKSMGFNTKFLSILVTQAFFYLLQPYLPTPGGSGIAEVGYDFLAKNLANTSSPAFIFLWRLLSFYLPMIVGAILIIPKSTKLFSSIKKERLNQK